MRANFDRDNFERGQFGRNNFDRENFENGSLKNEPNQLEYGFVELKSNLYKNTYKSFIYSLSSLVLFFFLISLTKRVDNRLNEIKDNIGITILGPEIKIKDEQPKIKESVKPEPKNLTKNSGQNNINNDNFDKVNTNVTTSSSGKGDYIPTNKDVVSANIGMNDLIHGLDNIGESIFKEFERKFQTDKGSGGSGANGGNGGGGLEDEDFIAVEEEPKIDISKLQRFVEYPKLALVSRVEGRVIVKVLVNEDGSVNKMMVEYTDNILLNQAALDAIKNYGNLVPAKQNGTKVKCWISIPINFKIK